MDNKERRQELRKQRRIKFWQCTWRLVFLSGSTFVLLWGMKLPYWFVRGKEQIDINGNELMLEADVRSLIALDYPEYLWRLDAKNIIQQLEAEPPIINAQLTRQLFPVKIKVLIQERQPVALVLSPKVNKKTATPSKILLGFLDKEGVFIPERFYRNQAFRPTLTVVDFQPQYQPYWLKIYSFIENSEVKVFEVNWAEPTVILLKTELGVFYLGNYNTQLDKQLQVIKTMKQAREKLDTSTIDYIDLSNPELPLVKLKS
ncbi:cell division protein FtsQ/DivIB [Gloeocapsa sp. PCC 73106]|uniref:cell division protein FtsQ/DivIB n=1 Tax=Gloeocapsa sp. PCC 73106 TaxID=102232 RepID=UPI0002ACAF3E|nr:FtsQ-type POTRA domain-containing protein [Gloeocapsa sp. PCC 73106]ELR96507.1 cell division septal protein [Gloeocapsa sp. PCC 73106]